MDTLSTYTPRNAYFLRLTAIYRFPTADHIIRNTGSSITKTILSWGIWLKVYVSVKYFLSRILHSFDIYLLRLHVAVETGEKRATLATNGMMALKVKVLIHQILIILIAFHI